MPCYHPRRMVPVGHTEKGKIKYEFYPNTHPRLEKWYEDVTVPCGQCCGCRLEYSRQWAIRMTLEMEYHPETWFVTLTYDDANVPESVGYDKDGVKIDTLTLRKRDVQLFLKNLRRQLDYKIRFFCAGEYGDEYGRPHYHLIIFGLKGEDMLLYSRKILRGFDHYKSHLLEYCWQDFDGHKKSLDDPIIPRGFVDCSKATFETCAYVARYVTKKLTGKAKSVYDQLGIVGEYATMSRKPGIAHQYYDDHKHEFFQFSDLGDKNLNQEYNDSDIFIPEKIVIPSNAGARSVFPPKYFDHILEEEDLEGFRRMKKQKKEVMKQIEKEKAALTDASLDVVNAAAERNAIMRSNKLLRRFERDGEKI